MFEQVSAQASIVPVPLEHALLRQQPVRNLAATSPD
jgi:hypothetical protein